jgi:tetratricopeptide (TPR) repeat protein
MSHSPPTPSMTPLHARRLAIAILAGALLATPRLVVAAEDGGTLSPFARGAGGRAMGMAGAFVATADDATALVWNPGGLARATRFGLVADYARLDASDTGERFAALVVPSWRWGALGLSMRQLGVGGIDARDDRNVQLPGELSASETEIALGYARSFGRGIGLGGALKLQRSSVGGFSGSGYGADLGVSVDAGELVGDRWPWAVPLSMGLAVRNALEPAQRLDQESVPDPRLVRWGCAWRRDLSPFLGLTVALGLEQTTGRSTHFDVGSELEVGRAMALRGGIQGSRLTGGTSVRWSGLSVDYAYEQRDLGMVQHVGISKSIGRTVSESQTATRQAQERALAERLDQAYAQRLTDQVAGLISQAEEAQAAGRLAEALDAVAAARALAPKDARAARLEASLLSADGERLLHAGDAAGAELSFGRALEAWPSDSLATNGRARAQAELKARANRSQHVRELDQGYRLFASGDLVAARVTFRKLHDITPADTAVTAMLRRVERLIGDRVTASLSRARHDIEAGRFDEAERDIDAAHALEANEADLLALRSALAFERRRTRDAQANVGLAVRAPVSPQGPTPAQRREADRHYRQGLQLATAGQTDPALRLWELALSLDPGHTAARQALGREYLLRGMSAFGRGRFSEAETYWARVVELDPTDVGGRPARGRARTPLERTRELTGTGP